MNFLNFTYKKYNFLMASLGYDYQIKTFFFDHLDKGKRVDSILEVGCGSGIAGLSLLELFERASSVFTDINVETMLKLKKKVGTKSRISLGVSDISNPRAVTMLSGGLVRLEDESFDVICAGANIGYSTCPEFTISALYDLLRPGGYIIDLEMRFGLWGRLISSLYKYRMVLPDQINAFTAHRGAVVSSKNISWRYFPLNLTRVFIMISKPL